MPIDRARVLTIASCTVPILLALALYWPGLTAWFQMDDFSLLSLRDRVHDSPSLLRALFAPVAQGTIRTISERAFYLTFTSAFGIRAFPFRIFAFLTFAATLPLVSSIAARLTSSRAVGFWTAILWTVNSGIAVALSWTAVYYELLCAFVFVLNFWLLLRYAETGKLRFYVLQWIIFLLGFGVLEINVVYPAIAVAYAILRARPLIWKTAAMFLGSAAYLIARSFAVSMPVSGPYRMHWDFGSIAYTLWTYWNWALEPRRLEVLGIGTPFTRATMAALLGTALLAFLVWKLYRRGWIAALFPTWFLIVLAPLLPLRDHITDYYLAVPLIGLAMAGGWGLVCAWRAGLAGRIAAAVLLAVYLAAALPVTRASTTYYHDRSQRIRTMVLGVDAVARANQGKMLVLTGIDKELFWTGVYHHPFQLFGIREIYVAPEEAPAIGTGPQEQPADPFFAERNAVRFALAHHGAVIIDVSGDAVRDNTAQYAAAANIQAADAVPSRIDVGNNLYADLLGPTWYPNEGGFRWIPKRATLKLHGPQSPGAKLYLTGLCPEAAAKSGPLRMEVSVDGMKLAPATITQGRFALSFELPSQLDTHSVVEIAVELDHVFVPATDRRPLGVIFGTFEIR